MRMVPPLRGVWASAVATSASPKPATIAIILNIMFPPTMQAYSDQRVDHSQHVERKLLERGWRMRTLASSRFVSMRLAGRKLRLPVAQFSGGAGDVNDTRKRPRLHHHRPCQPHGARLADRPPPRVLDQFKID